MNEKAIAEILNVLANPRRMIILEWLKDPVRHFPPQRDGDLVQDGVCVGFLTEKLHIRQPSVTSHMRQLENAGLVSSKKIKNWVFYKLDQAMMDEFLRALRSKLSDG